MLLGRGFMLGLMGGGLFSILTTGVLGRLPGPGLGQSAESSIQDNAELARLFDEDQADRTPQGSKAIDWTVVQPRDRQRETRVKTLYEAAALHTGKDFYRAAMVLQHASKPDDYLLAHEFCIVALARGERSARWLAAATEDRFLMNIGRSQRFGTQYRSSGPAGRMKLYKVGPGVTDGLRGELAVPTLAEAREHESMINDLTKGRRPGLSKP